MDIVKCFLLLITILYCDGASIWSQLVHIARRQKENQLGISSLKPSRRYNIPGESSVILGAPSFPSHLPEAEPILPGHTLIRPALGMLKSAVKFPHREHENGAGVYGSIDNLGIKYDGRNERVLYSGFRRTPDTYMMGITGKQKPNIYKPFELQNIDLSDLLRLINSLRRDEESNFHNNLVIIENPKSQEHNSIPEGDVDSQENKIKVDKQNWFWNSKDAYNHITVNEEAPDHVELLPKEAYENLQDWWFYHQEDFESFENR